MITQNTETKKDLRPWFIKVIDYSSKILLFGGSIIIVLAFLVSASYIKDEFVLLFFQCVGVLWVNIISASILQCIAQVTDKILKQKSE